LCSDSLRMQNLLSLHNTLEKLGCYDESWEPPLSCVFFGARPTPRPMQRRLARERREYLQKRSGEARTQEIHERKKLLKHYLDEENLLPRSLIKDARKLRELLSYDDIEHDTPKTHVDDEYALAGFEDPRVLMTTSHDPSQRLLTFVKEMKLIFPNCQRMNRGNIGASELTAVARQHGFTDIVVFHETRGEPDAMIVQHLPYGPSFYFTLFNVVRRHEIPDVAPMSLQYPHLIFENFTTPLGKRVMDGLRYLFPVVTNPDTNRVMTFDNNNDFISFRHHNWHHVPEKKKIVLVEAGPRFEMRLFQIKLGTMDMPEAETEWLLRPYMNTAKKRRVL